MSEEQNPGLIGEIVDGLHNLEEKVERAIHGDGAPSSTEPVQEAGGAAAGESIGSSASIESSPGSAGGDNPNAAASAAASTSLIESASSVLPASLAGAAAVVGTYASDQIKARLASIKQQLDVHHFEQSLVAAIHADLDAIEGML